MESSLGFVWCLRDEPGEGFAKILRRLALRLLCRRFGRDSLRCFGLSLVFLGGSSDPSRQTEISHACKHIEILHTKDFGPLKIAM